MNIQDLPTWLGLLMVTKSGICKFTWHESLGFPAECYVIYVTKYKMKIFHDQNHSFCVNDVPVYIIKDLTGYPGWSAF